MRKIEIMVSEGVEIPSYETEGSIGFDLRAHSILSVYKASAEIEKVKLEAIRSAFNRGEIGIRGFERVLFGTGIFVDLPVGTELQIRSRSGQTLNKGLVVLNSPGTIDSDYKKEVGVIICNNSPFLTKVKKGERIAQGIFVEGMEQYEFVPVDTMPDSERGGFGSTGTK